MRPLDATHKIPYLTTTGGTDFRWYKVEGDAIYEWRIHYQDYTPRWGNPVSSVKITDLYPIDADVKLEPKPWHRPSFATVRATDDRPDNPYYPNSKAYHGD